jgi:RNA polymerase sigma-70 factor, ECF subfamily
VSDRTATTDDRLLVAAFLERRDEEAFRALFRRHAPAMLRTARRLLAPRIEAAEDVVQEAWLRAARGLGGFAWRSPLRTWLLGIVVHRCRDEWRRRPAAGAQEALDGPGPPVASRVDLERAVAALPAGYREALLLHDVEELTHEEIAAVRGVTPGTSKSQLARARAALRQRLQGEEGR